MRRRPAQRGKNRIGRAIDYLPVAPIIMNSRALYPNAAAVPDVDVKWMPRSFSALRGGLVLP